MKFLKFSEKKKSKTENNIVADKSVRKYINDNFIYTSAVIEFIDTLHYQPIKSLQNNIDMLNMIFEDGDKILVSEIDTMIHEMGEEGKWMNKIGNFNRLANIDPLSDFGSLFTNRPSNNQFFINEDYFKEFLFVFYDNIVGAKGEFPSGISFTKWYSELRDREGKFDFEYDRVKFAVSSFTETNIFQGYVNAFIKLNDDILTIINTNGIKYLEVLSKIITNKTGKCVDYATDFKDSIRKVQSEFWFTPVSRFVLKNGKLDYNSMYAMYFDDIYLASSENGSICIKVNGESKYISFNEVLYTLTSLTQNPFVKHASPNVLYTAAVYIYFMKEAESILKKLIFE